MTYPANDPRNLFERYVEAVAARDVEAFASLYSDDVRIFDAWESWSQEGAAAPRNLATSWFASLGKENVKVSAQDVQTKIGQDMAMLTAIVKYAAISTAGEQIRFLQNRFTWVAQYLGGRWTIVHEHSSAPIRPDHLTAILQMDS